MSKDTCFTSFVLGDFVNGVFSAVFAFAVSTTSLWNVDCMSASLGKQRKGMNTHGKKMRSSMDNEDGLMINSLVRCDCHSVKP